MANELEIFIDYLRKKDLKLTDQRRLILKVFLKTERHLSVDDLCDIVRKKDLGIGHTTIFRTLKLLREADIAKEVNLGDGKTRYEHKYGHEHHDHLICVKCGRFIEAMDSKIERLQSELCKKYGFLPQRHKMQIFGLCKKCRR